VSNQPLGQVRNRRGGQATEKTRAEIRAAGQEEGLDCQGTHMERVWGSPWYVERAPRKLGSGGAKRVGKGETMTHDVGFQLATIYTYTLENLFHFNDKAWREVDKRILENDGTHQGEKQA